MASGSRQDFVVAEALLAAQDRDRHRSLVDQFVELDLTFSDDVHGVDRVILRVDELIRNEVDFVDVWEHRPQRFR